MIFRIHTPNDPLRQFVESMIYYEGYAPGHSIERLLPEGVIELIIDLTETPKHIYDNEQLTAKQSCRRAWISGMRREFISIEVNRAAKFFVIRFRRGCAYPFLRIPIGEFDHQVVEADAVFRREIDSLREQLAESPTPESRFALAERFLLQRAAGKLAIHPVIDYALRHIDGAPAEATVASVLSKTGYSHKHFIALFHRHVGLTPKSYARIVRFQHAVRQIERSNAIHWAALAADCGYYDQAHFIKEFREFSGLSPTVYVDARGEYLNYLPVR